MRTKNPSPEKIEEFEIKCWPITIKVKNPTIITVIIVVAVLVAALLI